MPLHATGDYKREGLEHRAYGFAVSSYIPTVASLLRASQKVNDVFNGVLAVSESSTLPGTIREIDAVVNQLGSNMVTGLNNENASKSTVLDGMVKRSWIHLACHGIQNKEDPLKSSFQLHDGDLELSDIMRKSFDHGGLAFLSACQTATGHDELPDEAIHLAAGMLSAGYSSIIGTMWSIQDEDAPLVASEFYSRVIDKDKGTGDVRKSAWALHEATAKLREEVGEKELIRWVPFIHMGV
jgi:CHAT domain-containing protein